MSPARRRVLSAARTAALAFAAAGELGAARGTELLSAAHVPASVAGHLAEAVGRPDAARVMHVAIALPMRHRAELDALLRDLQDPASPDFRRFLSVAEFTER